jgi:hypothetical protein
MPLYAGMTVNERLVKSGQIAAWDAAVAGRDRADDRGPDVTELSEKQAAETSGAAPADPQKCRNMGFRRRGGEPLIPSFRGAR